MSTDTDLVVNGSMPMTKYDAEVWDNLNRHWKGRDNHRGLPNWASAALMRSGDAARRSGKLAADAVPEAVKKPIRLAGGAVATQAARPALEAAASLLELLNDWAKELNDPKTVEKIARKRGLEIDSFNDLRKQDLKVRDRLLTRNTLKWRTVGALEGGAMGLLALVPVAGIPVAITADILAIQVLSLSIASHVAYSYGYDAKDPTEQVFIQRLVRRSFMEQAAKARPLRETALAAHAVKDRVRWSPKLRQDHRLLAAIEKLMQQIGPSGAKVPIKHVAKVVPVIGALIGAGTNAVILGRVAADAQRYCQTRTLCETYGLLMPAALVNDSDDWSPKDL